MTQKKLKECAYIPLSLIDMVVFPRSLVPLLVTREQSIQALQHITQGKIVGKDDCQVLLLTQKNPFPDNPTIDDLFSVGTRARIVNLTQLPDGSYKVLVEGIQRIQITGQKSPFLVIGKELVATCASLTDANVLYSLVIKELSSYLKLAKRKVVEPLSSLLQPIHDSSTAGLTADHIEKNVDLIIPQLPIELATKQKILEAPALEERLDLLLTYLGTTIGRLQVEKTLLDRMQDRVKKEQQEYVEQIKKRVIKDEYGGDELDDLERRLNNASFPEELRAKADAEFKKLRSMSALSAEASIIRNYLDCLLALPWVERSELLKDLDRAESVLSAGHYGLEDVKRKILEFLAVQNRTGLSQGAVLCLSGPPGVGKTSLAEAIAEATNRDFVRISLGGVRDEAAIRGHRRTYVGAMPGQLIQGMKKVKKRNPLFLLDEIDKMGSDGFHGDPAAALLELLDPKQNNEFVDHYLDWPYDFSEVFFICTANYIQNIPEPLRDRMEFVDISSYTELEKVQIAKLHLVPNQKKKKGLTEEEFKISDGALLDLVRLYSREAGVRSLERWIASLARKTVMLIDRSKMTDKPVTHLHITQKNLKKYAGIPIYQYGQASRDQDRVGVVSGLAYTGSGGDLLSIQVVSMPRLQTKEEPSLTGNLGQIMKESVKVAITLARLHAAVWGIDPSKFENDLHIHVSEGAVPKEGPSAGVTLFTALVSALTGIPCLRNVAMTGEISLTGEVGKIGGLKEKLLAAQRGGITLVLIPVGNEGDLEEIPENVKKGLTIIPVRTVQEVLENALMKPCVLQSDPKE